MKKHRTLFITVFCLLFASSAANAGQLGDVDLDGKVGLTEAVNALQVISGVRSPLSASYVIVWKGAWATGQNYQVYDAVHLNGSSYICLQHHTSDISKQPPYAPVWEPLAIKGDKGDQGIQGIPGPTGTNSPEFLAAICQLAKSANIKPELSFCDYSQKVFVSSATYTGNLGGLVGADAKCQALAVAAGFFGTFKAWLSDSTQSPAARFLRWPYPYKRVDGTMVAMNWNDLVDGNLMQPIRMTETGAMVPSPTSTERVWTATNIDGSFKGEHGCFNGDMPIACPPCADWTTEIDPQYVTTGRADGRSQDWTWTGSSHVSCSQSSHLYCFQQ